LAICGFEEIFYEYFSFKANDQLQTNLPSKDNHFLMLITPDCSSLYNALNLRAGAVVEEDRSLQRPSDTAAVCDVADILCFDALE